MTPDLRFPHSNEFDPQQQLDMLRARMSYVLEYPEYQDDEECLSTANSEDSIWINKPINDLTDYLYEIRNSQTLGDTKTPIKIKRLTDVIIKDQLLIDTIYQAIFEETFPNTKPIKIFFLEGEQSAIMIIPLEVENDLFAVQVVPMVSTKPCNDPILCEIQKYWNTTGKSIQKLLATGDLKPASKIDKSKNKR
jgi:hypothetical protein